MMDAASPRRPMIGAGLVCFKGDHVLLIKRGKAPRLGEWSIPGGHLEWGETTEHAALRETLEETGVTAQIHGLIEVIDAISPAPAGLTPERHMVLVDYVGTWISGEPSPGDDASDARFVPLRAVDDLGLWSETARIIKKAAALLGVADGDGPG